MIGRLDAFLRRLRRIVSRSEWTARWLRLTLSSGTADSPGLVMIQIDGLARPEAGRALERGELPFLRSLLAHQHYRLHDLYSGLPSATATVQGELFYGVPGAVAGFNFLDSATGELVRMFEPTAAARVERGLAGRGGAALLEGGSCYAANFTGGAAEPHFCPAAVGWGPGLRDAAPLAAVAFFVLNIPSLLRVAGLAVVELGLAVFDFVRGTARGESVAKELKFIPMRIGVSIVLREFATIGARMDVARGLSIVHVNFLGYDEQSHRRGPDSAFAHWTLKGIDGAIGRIWRAAHRSGRRRYDVWIYSDHGQERTRAYRDLHGVVFSGAVAQVFARVLGREVDCRTSGAAGWSQWRARWIGGRGARTQAPAEDDATGPGELTIAPLGPVAMIYSPGDLLPTQAAAIAGMLVREAAVPVVLAPDGPGRARAWTSDGEMVLPDDAGRLLGADHPFVADAARDLVALCHHPDAGRFIACGWRSGVEPVTFTDENGSHGGAGPRETNAFALLPDDVPLLAERRSCLRPVDLHRAALRVLGRSGERRHASRIEGAGKAASTQAGGVGGISSRTVRVMTYNVHSCLGMDGRLAPERVARLIARYDADIIALQELDVSRARSGGIDQALAIAKYLEMDFHFHPTLHLEEERYGDAIVTHLPMRLVRAGSLPGLPHLEPRGALWVAVDLGGVELQVINTHLGLTARERRMQVDALLGPLWLGSPECRSPVVLCGDFNAFPSSTVCRRLRERLKDAQADYAIQRPRATFFGRFPMARIDHVFISTDLEVVDIEVPTSALARVASDHLPLVVELKTRHTLAVEGGRLRG